MKPGFSVSTINPSKSKTIAASVILIKPEANHNSPGLTLAADFEKIAIGEKAFQLPRRVLRAVRTVDYIKHGISAEITSDRSLRRFPRIGWAHKVANARYSIFARPGQRDDRAGLHEGLE